MGKRNKNKFWSGLLACFCSVVIALTLLGAGTRVSDGDKESSYDISNTELNLAKVEALYTVHREDVVYTDNNIQSWDEVLPSTVIFYGINPGGIKYLIDSNLGVNKINYSELAYTVSFRDYNVQKEQESLGHTVNDFINIYFDYGYVTFVQLKFDVAAEFDVRIYLKASPNIYVDVRVVYTDAAVYCFDDDASSMQSSTYSVIQFWRDIQGIVSEALCPVVNHSSLLVEWRSITDLRERIKAGTVYTDNLSDEDFVAYTDQAKYAELIFQDFTLSPDCVLSARNNVGGSYEWVEVINCAGTYSVYDSVPDWDSDEDCSEGWYENYTGICMAFWFEYDAQNSELHLFITVDSEYDQLDIWNAHTLSEDQVTYVFQERVLANLDFGQDPGYGGDSACGGAQGSIGWFGGEYYVYDEK